MNLGLLSAAIGLIATLSATEFIRVLALRFSAVDRPGGRRIHRQPTARMGGLGIYWGVGVALLFVLHGVPDASGVVRGPDAGMIGLLAGAQAMLIAGLLDDIYGLPAVAKLLVQCAAGVLLYQLGWRVESVGLPGVGAIAAGPLSLALTVGWVVLVTNAINLVDGMDGLATGVALVAALAAAALLGAASAPEGMLALALAGALLGFLWFNLNPALIFMGDAGSLFVGFLLAGLTLRAGHAAGPGAFPLVPVLLVAIPLFDTASAIARRMWRAFRASRHALDFARRVATHVMAPDADHVHHRLLRTGLTARRSAALLWLAAAGFAMAGVVAAHRSWWGMGATLLLAAAWGRGWIALPRSAATTSGAALPVGAALPAVAALPAGAAVPAGSAPDQTDAA